MGNTPPKGKNPKNVKKKLICLKVFITLNYILYTQLKYLAFFVLVQYLALFIKVFSTFIEAFPDLFFYRRIFHRIFINLLRTYLQEERHL